VGSVPLPKGYQKRCQKVTLGNLCEYVSGEFYRGGMFTWFRHKAIDRELTELLDEHARVRADASQVRDFLLRVLEDNRNGVEKFSDAALQRASEIIDQVGPGAFYWMTDIAAQMVVLSEATLHGHSTNVSVELGAHADADSIVELVVRIP